MKNKLIVFLILVFVIFSFLIKKKEKIIIYTSIDIKNYNNLLNENVIKYTTIPKIIIKTSWQDLNNIPIEMKNALEITKQINPDYQLYYFNDTDVLRFMKDYSDIAYKCYQKIIPGAFKADLFRLCILEKYGGCYSDIGHLMKVGFDEICEDCNIVLVNDKNLLNLNLININLINPKFYGIHNALMCTVPHHPFFQKLIEKCCENITNNYYGEDALDITGPRMIGKVYNCYFADKCNDNADVKDYGIINYIDDKINMLKFVTNILNLNTKYIYNNNKCLIQTKFDNYYNIMYTVNKTPRYDELWKQRKVYH
jgi:mannosyltransferase OCH1-like enzyme